MTQRSDTDTRNASNGTPSVPARYLCGRHAQPDDELPIDFTFDDFTAATSCLLPHERCRVFHALPERLQTAAWRALEREMDRAVAVATRESA